MRFRNHLGKIDAIFKAKPKPCTHRMCAIKTEYSNDVIRIPKMWFNSAFDTNAFHFCKRKNKNERKKPDTEKSNEMKRKVNEYSIRKPGKSIVSSILRAPHKSETCEYFSLSLFFRIRINLIQHNKPFASSVICIWVLHIEMNYPQRTGKKNNKTANKIWIKHWFFLYFSS